MRARDRAAAAVGLEVVEPEVVEPEFEVGEPEFEVVERPHVANRWANLIRKLRRIKRLQRLWAQLGSHLKNNVSKFVGARLKRLQY